MIKQSLFKLTAIIITILFFLLTGADMYIKNYGDLSQFRASEEEINQVNHLSGFYQKDEKQIRLMTYNLLADTIGFEGVPAQTRADLVCNMLNAIAPDVCGFQETSRRWFACIYNNTDYKFIHPVRAGVLATMTTLAYNPATLYPVAFGEQVFKNGDSSPLRRMVWGVFRHKKSDKIFAVVNTHFSISTPEDNTTPLTQALELITLCKELKSVFKCPVFPLGDFNAQKGSHKAPSPIYDVLTTAFQNTTNLAERLSHGEGTSSDTKFIDHIFAFGDVSVPLHVTLSQKIFISVSDHRPIFCDFYVK